MSEMPRLGVVVTTYDRPDKLQRLLRSLLTQSYKDFEVLVVDDASKTALIASEPLVKEFEDAGIKLAVVELPHNSGYLTKPRNVGFGLLENEFVSYCDDDDEILPDHFASHMLTMEQNPEIAVVYSLYRIVRDDDGDGQPTDGFEQFFVAFNPYQLMAGPMHNFINSYQTHRRALLEEKFTDERKKVWNEEIQRFGDWEFCIRAYKEGLQFKGIDKVTLLYHFHGENLQLTRPCTKDLKSLDSESMSKGGRVQWRGSQSVRL